MNRLSPNIKKLLLFLLILIGINELARQYFYRVSVKNHKLNLTDQQFYSESDQEISTLFMGHSRPLAGIETKVLNSVSQFCSPGETSAQTYYKLKYLLEHSDKKIEQVILPFGFGTFCHSKPEVLTHSWYWKKYVDYSELGSISEEYWSFLSVKMKSTLVPYYEYPSLRLRLHFNELNPSLQSKEYSEMNLSEKDNFSASIVTQQSKTKNLYSDASLKYLQKTITLCKDFDIELTFIEYPISSYYREASFEYVTAHKCDITSFKKELEFNNIPLLDYSQLFDGRDELYKDPQHLNENGRTVLTLQIKEDLGL